MRTLLTLVALLAGGSAWAQTTGFGAKATNLAIDWTHPTEDDGGRLDCEEVVNGCHPINAASCDGDDRPIRLFLRETTTQIPVDSKLFVWLTSGTCTFTAAEKPADALLQVLDSNDPLVTAGEPDFEFPNDFEPNNDYTTVNGIVAAVGACDGDGLDDTTYRLCFGFSVASGGSADDAVEDTEPHGYIEFVVDTAPPEAPVISVTPRDRRLSVHAEIENNAIDDVDHWIVRYRVAPDPSVVSTASCDTWTDASETDEIEHLGDEPSATLDLEVQNGVTYELCVYAVDHAGNAGGVSANALGTPQDECDFFECFPGEPPSGYCGAGGSSAAAALLALAGLLRRRQRGKA